MSSRHSKSSTAITRPGFRNASPHRGRAGPPGRTRPRSTTSIGSTKRILAIVRAAFPAASILAEESGTHAGDPELRWIVDPLDGTRGFTRGGSFWGPLVALEHRGEIVAGAA